MEEMSPAVAMTLSIGSSMCESSAISNQVEITCLKLVTDAVNLFSDPVKLVPEEFINITPPTVLDDGLGGSDFSMQLEDGGRGSSLDVLMVPESEEDEILFVVKDTDAMIGEVLLALEAVSEINLPKHAETENRKIVTQAVIVDESNEVHVPTAKLLIAAANPNSEISDVSEVKASAVVLKLPSEKNVGRGVVTRSVYELDCIPLWGSVSMCGRRPEMEDAVATVPRFTKLPIKMLIGERVVEGVSESLTHLTTHFFGVYDGHGGSQVADYCRDRIHLALIEELEKFKNDIGSTGENMQVMWEKAFTSCFQKVDHEVGGKSTRCTAEGLGDASNVNLEPVAPETVGSTAVVALVCSSHIIVSNCGDSRAVLYRGKESMALSIDHKPNREDEYARIEASGGKVIQWNGHRVFGVLAMSRSIGDRYFRPWIIPEPEVMFVPRVREDECLILASDGLWDVMTNEEACEVARKRILMWHKKNVAAPLGEKGNGVDPAAQAAADHLSMLAVQKGSKDNISVIVVDLKAQRKFKTKPTTL